MEKFFTDLEVNSEVDKFYDDFVNKNKWSDNPSEYDIAHHIAKWAENKVSEYYEDRLDAVACEYTAKGYATDKKHLIEDLKEELNEIINWLSNGDEHSEIPELKGYKATLMWLDNVKSIKQRMEEQQ